MSKVTAHGVLGQSAMMHYDSNSQATREALAISLEIAMDAAGFKQEEGTSHREIVFSRPIADTGIRVQVWSTIVPGGWSGRQVRGAGADAIRVTAVYKTKEGKDRGVVSSTRVHRTGEVGGIVDRTLERARGVWTKARTGERCHHCGAPKFTAKSGKLVCAEICWTKK
jgi:hypothetical protein